MEGGCKVREMTTILKFRYIGHFTIKKNAPDCDICKDEEFVSRAAVVSLAPINEQGQALEINGENRYFVCNDHFFALVNLGRVVEKEDEVTA